MPWPSYDNEQLFKLKRRRKLLNTPLVKFVFKLQEITQTHLHEGL